jgi:hypothetical protein
VSVTAWAEEAGAMEYTVAVSLLSPRYAFARGRVIVNLRVSLYDQVRRMFSDPRCDDATRALVREYLTGRTT